MKKEKTLTDLSTYDPMLGPVLPYYPSHRGLDSNYEKRTFYGSRQEGIKQSIISDYNG